jgi:hypothetical protein
LDEAEGGLDEKFVARLLHLRQKRKAGLLACCHVVARTENAERSLRRIMENI